MNNKVIKAGTWYTVSNFLIKGISFITLPIFARLLTKDELGQFSNITAWFNILAIITTFELYSSVSIARFDFKNELKKYISSNLVLGTAITSVFYIFCLIFHTIVEQILMIDFFTLNIMFIYLLVYPSIQMLQIEKQITHKYKTVVTISFLSSFLSTITSIILILIFKNRLCGRIVGHFIPLILISLLVYVWIIKDGVKITKRYSKYAIKVSLPLIVHLLAGYLLSSSDKIMITKMVSSEANALYSVAYNVSLLVSLLWTSLNNAWSPWAYKQMDEKRYDKLKKYSKPYFLGFLVVVYVAMLITPELLLFMGGRGYMEAKYVMPPVMVGYVFQFVYSLYVNIEFYHKKQKNIAIGTTLACIINIILNYIFIPKYGYIAAAYTTLVGYIVLYIVHYRFVRKLGVTGWYDNKFFLKLLFISLIYMFMCNYLYTLSIVRYFVIGVCVFSLLVLVIFRRKILDTRIGRRVELLIKLIKSGKEK